MRAIFFKFKVFSTVTGTTTQYSDQNEVSSTNNDYFRPLDFFGSSNSNFAAAFIASSFDTVLSALAIFAEAIGDTADGGDREAVLTGDLCSGGVAARLLAAVAGAFRRFWWTNCRKLGYRMVNLLSTSIGCPSS